MKRLNFKKTRGFAFLLLCFLTFFSVNVSAQPSPEPVTIEIQGPTDACPGDPLSFSVSSSRNLPAKVKYSWYKVDYSAVPQTTLVGQNNTFAIDSYPEDADSYILRVRALEEGPAGFDVWSEDFEIKKSTNCDAPSCHQTATGEYYSGTDFDPNLDYRKGGIDFTGGNQVISYFENDVELNKGQATNVKIVSNDDLVEDGYFPYSPSKLDEGKPNYYLKYTGLTNVWSPFIDFESFNGKSFRMVMRVYLVPKCDNESFNFKLDGSYGTGVSDQMLACYAYDDKTDVRVAEVISYNNNQPNVLVDGSKFEKGKLYRLDYIFSGIFRANRKDFGIHPVMTFNNSNCFNLAIDFISLETQTVCVTPRSACIGDEIVVNAAGFPFDSDYKWEKKNEDGSYTELADGTEVEYDLDEYGKKKVARITMFEVGSFDYRVSSTESKYSDIYVDFKLVGKNCQVTPPDVRGGDKVCITEYPHSQRFFIENVSQMYSFKGTFGKDYTILWRILDSEGNVPEKYSIEYPNKENDSDLSNNDVINLLVEEGAKTSDQFDPDAQYLLLAEVHDIYGGNVSAKSIGTDTVKLWVYDQPNVGKINLVTKYGQDTICAPMSSDTIILEGMESLKGYNLIWEGATMDADSTIHLNGYNLRELCEVGDSKSFPVKLDIANGECKATLYDTFYVKPIEEPTIDCSKMSDPTEYILSPSALDTTIKLPIPEFTTSCDEKPNLKVTLKINADNKAFCKDTAYVLTIDDINTKNTDINLHPGKIIAKYEIVDGCGRTASCETEITLRDTTAPDVDCSLVKNYTDSISKHAGCEISASDLGIRPDTLVDNNFKDTVVYVIGEYAGRFDYHEGDPLPTTDDTTIFSKDKGMNDAYPIGITYILWRFSDPSGNASYCLSKVEVVNDIDMFDCSQLPDMEVSVNENRAGHNYRYASAEAQGAKNPDTKYSLEGKLFIPKASDSYCQKPVTLEIRFSGVCVDAEGDTIVVAKDSLISAEDFMKHRFPIGATNVRYIFRNSVDSIHICEQVITVFSKDHPIPNGCPADPTLYVGDDCLAKWDITLDQVPTASVTYTRDVKYVRDCDDPNQKEEKQSNSLTGDVTVTVYPFKVRRVLNLDDNFNYTANSIITDCVNPYLSSDSVAVKVLQHRNRNSEDVCRIDTLSRYALKLVNFTELPACVSDSFSTGKHAVVWYFDNGQGVLDSCYTKITVVDTIPPVLDCGNWSKDSTFYVDETCLIPASVVNLTVPSLDDLDATDNCTPRDELKLTWTRTYIKNGKDTSDIKSLDEDYLIGKTIVHWVVTDLYGNPSYCEQIITVLDTMGPDFDCSSLKPIIVAADENCEASADVVVKAGLITPKAADDVCSPTGDSIAAIGTRSDGKDIFSDPYPKDTTIITWVFLDSAKNKKVCEQLIIVNDSTGPIVPDCDNLRDTTYNLLPEECVASLDSILNLLGKRSGKDNCDGEIEGKPYEYITDSVYRELPDVFKKDTTYRISWVFVDKSGNKTFCYQNVTIKDVTPPDVDTICSDPTKSVAAKVECTVSYDDLGLSEKVLDDPCDGEIKPSIEGVIRNKQGDTLGIYHDDELRTLRYPTGTHSFTWTYTDKGGNSSYCYQELTVIDSVPIIVEGCDGNKDAEAVLPEGECSLPVSELSKFMVLPTAYDPCDQDSIEARIERWFDGKLVLDANGNPATLDSIDFPLGKTTIKWFFADKLNIMKDSCIKSITVKTKLFDCKTLKDTVRVKLLENFTATAEEVRLAGLEEPKIIIDSCHAAVLSFSRSDGAGRDDEYKIGFTTVRWKFRYVFGDTVSCPQVVDIVDMVPPVLKCPPLPSESYQCVGYIPDAIETWEEFLAAGGEISEPEKYKIGSFGHRDTFYGTSCENTFARTYYVRDVRDNLIECDQTVTVKDTEGPTFLTSVDTIVVSCADFVDYSQIVGPDSILVEDNCSPSDRIAMDTTYSDNRGKEHTCDYRNYTIWRSWTAVDTCGNKSTLTQVILVRDTSAPVMTLPEGWRDTILSNNVRECEFIAPNLSDLLKGHISDDCSDTADIKLWQDPEAGSVLKQTTYVYIYAEDLCGNRDSVGVYVIVDKVENIVTLTAYDKTFCAEEGYTVISDKLRVAEGSVLRTIGDDIYSVPAVFSYDCYVDSIAEKNLVFSNNKTTYAHKFDNYTEEQKREIISLNRRSKSAKYYFVAMDTITKCKDTAMSKIDILEKPRVSLASGTYAHCEEDTLDLAQLHFDYDVCVNSMGNGITSEGWNIGGIDYKKGSPVPFVPNPQLMYYYAENSCGRSNSLESLFIDCHVAPTTKADSIALVGSEANLNLWREDKLLSQDSIMITVHQRYTTDSIMLAASPLYTNRIYLGDQLSLKLSTPYKPELVELYRVEGVFDGRLSNAFDKEGQVIDSIDRKDLLDYFVTEAIYKDKLFTLYPQDTSLYYVLIGDGVCPAVPSNVVEIDMLDRLPTAFTPFVKDGFNDHFLKGRSVIIFDRYGERVFVGEDGWDGTKHGNRVDPGVYFYEAVINGVKYSGTIELVDIR